MRDGSEIESLIDSLEALADEAEENRGKWKDVWGEIKSGGLHDNLLPFHSELSTP